MALGGQELGFSQCWLHDHCCLNGIIKCTVASTVLTTWELAFCISNAIVRCRPVLYEIAILVFTKCFSCGKVASKQAASLPGVSRLICVRNVVLEMHES